MFAMTTKNAEKLFDRFEDTSAGARRRLIETNTPEAYAFLQANSFDGVLDIVRNFQPDTKQFKQWKQLFVLTPDATLTESDFLFLDADPIIGWTATNSYRRVSLSEIQNAQLRMMYYTASLGKKDVLRWRIVHLLGAFPFPENIDLLAKALFLDKSEWVRYGSVRSLMEIASASEYKTRDVILSKIISGLKQHSHLVLREIRRTVLVRGAGADWYRAVYALVKKAADMPNTAAETKDWQQLLETIEQKQSE
jgi:hypothetical protein